MAQHTERESQLLGTHSRDHRSIVELGVAEGGSARLFRDGLAPGGTLTLIDPYPPGRLFGINMQEVAARRLVSSRDQRKVEWIRKFSFEAVRDWEHAIDFLFIDADHKYESVKQDWKDWSPFVTQGGIIALHDARVFPGGWTTPEDGPVRLVDELQGSDDWFLLDSADSTVVFRRNGRTDRVALAVELPDSC